MLTVGAAALVAGCPPSDPGPVTLDDGPAAPDVDYADLAVVLSEAIGADGWIIPSQLDLYADRLDAQLLRLKVTGPTATPELLPGRDDRLAYWYNARAAWSLRLVHLLACPQKVCPAELPRRSFPLDGRTMTLADIDEHLLGAFDDWRVVVAAPGALLQRAAPPHRPFSADDVRGRIAERIDAFIADEDRFVIDVDHRRIVVPPVIWRFRERIMDEYEGRYGARPVDLRQALLPHVDGAALRRLQNAVGYAPRPATRTLQVARRKEDY